MESGAAVENVRNGRISAFERTSSSRPQLGIGTDFDLGKSAWNSSSRIWGTSKSFLDTGVDDEPMTRMRAGEDETLGPPDHLLASPVRQTSSSSYGPNRLTPSSLLTPTESNNGNALPSQMPWNSIATMTGFTSRPRGQPLSPIKHRQNPGLDFIDNNSNRGLAESSLFAGSAPDVEDEPSDAQQTQQQCRAATTGSRFLHSPGRSTSFSRSEVSPQIQAFHSNKVNNTNGIFASIREFERDQEPSSKEARMTNGGTLKYPLHNSYAATRPTFGYAPDNLSKSDFISPTCGKGSGRSLTAERLDQFHSMPNTNLDEAVRSLRALSFDQAQDAVDTLPARRTSLPQPQYPRDIYPVPAHASAQRSFPFNPMESPFQPSSANVQSVESRLDPQAAPHYGGLAYAEHGALSPSAGTYRSSLHSPRYSATGTPPTGPQSIRSTPASGLSSGSSHHDPSMLDRKFPNMEHYSFDHTHFAPNSLQSQTRNGVQYDISPPAQPMRMNPLAHPYILPGHPGLNNFPSAPRIPIREPEQSQVIRSAVLEDFRMNSKTNKRYELKDIYNYVVEFSGDQHGSRFIQQKLETANSDEKEQIFKEIQPNVLQLMTDVFGNYVIQKLFEHGNQSQKKILANQMKGHVLHLSMQMYGCRVVQKAFEHVLTDQQASLVKELDGPNLQILKVVKDQNGNHVVQKAIERIPGEHIQFIVDAHRGQMAKMSTHQYGCRVVQRMLEHCQPKAKRIILDELLEHILPLVSDSYGNYVVQHIIQNGEPHDRRHVVNIVLQQLLTFSKHKYASNIVEKSIDCADDDQRTAILRGLTAPNEHGVTPVLGLMRDQYGNYVLQKVYSQLQGAELLALAADMKHNYPVLRRTSYGKQVVAMEKLLFGGNGPPTTSTSSRSSNLPSTNASSTVDGDGTPAPKPEVK
ncbi:uncharacterized protein Z518_01098 [Rhinocladiella mackenziei CBS 650.93]|uniref:Pumilio homology domain family member 3 n=1 Tax=Rhinocladiella mackenziei CBS 650.93 TaxID=1442369 RepID=A0A0D2G5F3_9EURO|nr:uncharacterized protein Z518_01098 [Rhinocladiella mackenziei CBS 650.93]KIX10017.1 hypothetical protein Z518_01098 [Rhinocladiella mackenziei CBS 650.93]